MDHHRSHVYAILLALVVTGGLLAAGVWYARSTEAQYIYALAPKRLAQKAVGQALACEAFRHADLLPVYGSSEFEMPDPYNANKILLLYPTGFTIFPVADFAAQPLTFAQQLASCATLLRGKKLVISLSPQFFTGRYSPEAYAGNFSRLHGYSVLLGAGLEPSLRQRLARRMLDYPETLAGDPVLRLAAQSTAGGSVSTQVAYDLLFPLASLEYKMLEGQDEFETLDLITNQPGLERVVPRRAAPVDWADLYRKAERAAQARATNNPFGIDNADWEAHRREYLTYKGERADRQFIKSLDSPAWDDLATLFLLLRAAGAHPLILSIPFNGPFYDYTGVSAKARQAYYDRLNAAVKPFGWPVVDLHEYEYDRYFLRDPGAHLSSKGWVVYTRAIDAFYHDGTLR
ncbi:MAG: D-alanyl-lipoteichoic acid biosynthesis protein DltD [Rudaea sp.]